MAQMDSKIKFARSVYFRMKLHASSSCWARLDMGNTHWSPWSGTRESLDGQRTPRTHTTQVAIMLLDLVVMLVVLASWCTRARYVRYYVYSVRFDFGELRNLLCALHTPCGGAHDARSSPRKALTKGWQMCPRSPRDAHPIHSAT